MKVFIAQIGSDQTVAFAAEELRKYFRRLDPTADVAKLLADRYDPAREGLLWVGQDAAFQEFLPQVTDAYLDDAIYLDVEAGAGIVTGNNPRSVLLAAYRLLRENGCKFLRPDAAGEVIPEKSLESLSAHLAEAPDCRHRGVCIEGCLAYQHVINMIDWLPKVGMNAYFTQFLTPYTFFEWWYAHRYNTTWPSMEISKQTVAEMTKQFVIEIKRRGLLYHAVGHAWTCEPFGLDGSAWTARAYEVPERAKPLLAEIKGKRALYENIPLNTNLCYGNPEARNVITDAISQYCAANPEVDYVHFWLADNSNNHCECELCRQKTPADWYVTMLNELDEKLIKLGAPTRVVFLAYVDTLWAPETERIVHPDRFCLMFAPITRTFSKPLPTAEFLGAPTPYRRNRNTMPESVEENVQMLRGWLKVFPGDGFDYDYHVGGSTLDFGGYYAAKVLFTDMQNLKKLGLNGMVSCQGQRAFFPTSLVMNAMAAALWDNSLDYDTFAAGYFRDAFGPDGALVQKFMRELSDCIFLVDMRHRAGELGDPEKFARAIRLADEFAPVAEKHCALDENPGWNRSWHLMNVYLPIVRGVAAMLERKAAGDEAGALAAWEPVGAYIEAAEADIHPDLEVGSYLAMLGRIAGKHYTIRVNE